MIFAEIRVVTQEVGSEKENTKQIKPDLGISVFRYPQLIKI